MDWTDKTREDSFIFEMLDPFDIESSRGYLEGVVSGSPSLTFGYYTDTRISGSLESINSNYIDYSLIRIYHIVRNWGYKNELGTFFVSNKDGAHNQAYKRSFDLVSMLCRVSDDALPYNFVIQQGATAKETLLRLFSDYGMSCTINATNDKQYSSSVVYEVGENVLSVMMDIANDANLRLELNGHGTVLVTNYQSPSKSQGSVFDFADDNGTISGDITETNDWFGTVNRVIVSSDQDEQTVSGFADRDSSSKVSYNNLGRRNAAVESVTDLTPFTNDGASSKASSLLGTYEEDPTEWTFEGIYIPYEIGSIVTLTLKGVTRYAMIKNKTVKLQPGMLTGYTLKEVY